ncbi:hypothetical protein EYF80_023325 [Liparis tanakae]|uniref:Uncharacterized protein n=1 Tax=Liparis tanakae TaxID=230148 RepID=A0A4Z2HKQ1_9TELE|nr:hypothetical protein EYF80_023325 [Liparis tanakae]
MLDEGLHQLWSQTGQAVMVSPWVTKDQTLLRHLPPLLCLWELEVKVRGEGSEEVQNVWPSVITQDAFGLDARAKLHRAVALVEHLYPRNDGLSDNTDAPIVHHSRPECVKTLHVYRRVRLEQSNRSVAVSAYLSSPQVAGGSSVSSCVAPQGAVVLGDVEPEAEEQVVPDEHLHALLKGAPREFPASLQLLIPVPALWS